jgi:hypothetical protein
VLKAVGAVCVDAPMFVGRKGWAEAEAVNVAYGVEHILARLSLGSRLICPELCMTMNRRPEYSQMPSITEVIQDPNAHEHRPCNVKYPLCESTHKIICDHSCHVLGMHLALTLQGAHRKLYKDACITRCWDRQVY